MEKFLKYLKENYPGRRIGKRFFADIERRRQDGPLLDFTFELHKGNEYIARFKFQSEPIYVGSTFPVYLVGDAFELPDYSLYPYRQ